MASFIKDILKEKNQNKCGEESYSQSRVYLAICVVVIIGVIITQLFVDLDYSSVDRALEYLSYLILIFGGYSVGSKTLTVFQLIKGPKHKNGKSKKQLLND